jgi:hypothetical protein
VRTACWLSRGAAWLTLSLLKCPQSPPCNMLQEVAWQGVRLALHIGEPAKCLICGRGLGSADADLQGGS